MSVLALIPTLGQRNTLQQVKRALARQTVLPDRIMESRSLDLPAAVAEILEADGCDFVAIVDDDVIIPSNFIALALPYFEDPHVAYVCGSLTPPSEMTAPMRAIAHVQASLFGSLSMRGKFKKGARKEDADETDIQGVGVYRSSAYIEALGSMGHIPFAGWETKIVRWFKEHGMKVVYEPEMSGIHRPRDSAFAFAKQSWRDGWGRAVYLKMWPGDMIRKPWFVAPPLFVLSLSILPFLSFSLWTFEILAYIFLSLWSSRDCKNALPYYFASHASYGLGVLYGLAFKGRPK